MNLILLLACVTPQRVERSSARTVLGAAYLSEGNPGDAIVALEEATRLNPRNENAWEKLAMAYYAQSATELSRKAFDKAVRLNPTKAEIRNSYGLMLLNEGEIESSIEQFETALADLTYRNTALILNNLGQAYYQNKQYESSIQVLTQAIGRAPNLCQAKFNRAFSYQEINRTELALQDFQEVITQCGDVATGAYYHAANLMIELGDISGGCNYLRTVVRESTIPSLTQEASQQISEFCKP